MTVPKYTDGSGTERESMGVFIPGSMAPPTYIDKGGTARESVGVFVTAGGLRLDRYTLTSNASGVVTVVYPTPFAAIPSVHLELSVPANNRQMVRITASSTTGFTALVEQRNQAFLSLLGLDILASGVTLVNGATVRAAVIEA